LEIWKFENLKINLAAEEFSDRGEERLSKLGLKGSRRKLILEFEKLSESLKLKIPFPIFQSFNFPNGNPALPLLKIILHQICHPVGLPDFVCQSELFEYGFNIKDRCAVDGIQHFHTD